MYKLIIAEDEKRELTYISDCIKRLFSTTIEIVALCSDGQSAVEQCVYFKPDIVFLDIQMPIMTGLEAAKKIRQYDSTIEIMFISAYGVFDYAKQAIEIGVIDYLLKPYLEEDIEASVKKIIQKIEKSTHIYSLDSETKDMNFIKNENNSPYVRKAIYYILSHFNKDISLQSVADVIKVSSGYLGKGFKQSTGISFSDFLTKVRIHNAKKILLIGDNTIYNVSEEVGFKDPTYFSKCFKKETGISPKEFLLNKRKI